MNKEKDNKLALFEGHQIRKALHGGEWWFSIIDVIEVLVRGDRPRKYWNDLKKTLVAEGYFEVSEKIGQLKMTAPDGKERIDEIENPELAMSRMQELYEKKGYPKEWIDKRLRGIAVRQDAQRH